MDEFMFVELHAGTYRYDPWGSGRFVEAGGSLVMPPGQAMRFTIDHADVSTCSFSSDLMHETARQVFDVDEVNLIEGAVAPVDAANAWLWHQTITSYRRGVLGRRDMYENDLVRRESARYLIVSAINGFGLVAAPVRKARGSAAARSPTSTTTCSPLSPCRTSRRQPASRSTVCCRRSIASGVNRRCNTSGPRGSRARTPPSSRATPREATPYDESPRETLHR